MPFESEAQRRFMWMKHPEIAKRWSDEYPNQGKLPYHKGGDGPIAKKLRRAKAGASRGSTR